jgi:hypothetical protein
MFVICYLLRDFSWHRLQHGQLMMAPGQAKRLIAFIEFSFRQLQLTCACISGEQGEYEVHHQKS